jgi:LPXTG-site transpeptidase (sortase) family protein
MKIQNIQRNARLALSITLILIVLLGLPGAALAAAGDNTLVSVDSSGVQANGDSNYFSISSDARYVAFQSSATNLVAGDTNGVVDIFLRDTVANTTTRVSVGIGGAQANGASNSPSISANGRFVAFFSYATNLVSGDTNGKLDVFVRDTVANTTTRVSVNSSGEEATGGFDGSSNPSISGDGRFVAFFSDATNLVLGDTNAMRDVFVRDTVANTTTRVSVGDGIGGVQGNSGSYRPSISYNGRYVAFDSWASNLSGDTNGKPDVFVRDTVANTTTRVSVDSSGVQGNGDSLNPSISGDGRYVAFYSSATNLVSGDTNGFQDVFVYDQTTGTTARVSVDSSGVQADNASDIYLPSISYDGRYVTFYSSATNLVAGDTNGSSDVFVRDTVANTTTRVSLGIGGAQANGFLSSISYDGRYIAFLSSATNLVGVDTNGKTDIFVHDTGDPINNIFTLISQTLAANGIASNIGNVTTSNWTSFPGLYFEKRTNVADPTTAIGKITFNSAVDLSNIETQTFLQSLWNYVDMANGRIAFDARTSAEFGAHGATLVMYDLPLGLTIDNLTVRDDSGMILDTSTVVSGFTQDPGSGNVTFSAAHFTQFDINTTVAPAALPSTGFAPDRVTALSAQPASQSYAGLGDLWLEIPRLGVQMNIVGVPQSGNTWDVSWLGNQAGWLQGTAFPTWNGNSVITGHVWNADNSAGPFVYLNTLWYGDRIIVHAWGQQYVYEVRGVTQVRPDSTVAAFQHKDTPWLTLTTCRSWDADKGTYRFRVLVQAALVSVK